TGLPAGPNPSQSSPQGVTRESSRQLSEQAVCNSSSAAACNSGSGGLIKALSTDGGRYRSPMLRPLYDKVLALAGGNYAGPWLAAVSFAESSVFPIPPDAMLAPMVFARPERAYHYAAICTIASVAGGALGYVIGYFLQPIGLAIVGFFGHAGDIDKFRHWYDQWGMLVILGKGLTPLPYKIVTITSGFLKFN